MDFKSFTFRERYDLLQNILTFNNQSLERLKPLNLFKYYTFKKNNFIVRSILSNIQELKNFKQIINYILSDNYIYNKFHSLIIENIEKIENFGYYSLYNFYHDYHSKNEKAVSLSKFISNLFIIFNSITIESGWNDDFLSQNLFGFEFNNSHIISKYGSYQMHFMKLLTFYNNFSSNLKYLKIDFDSEISKIPDATTIEKKYPAYLSNPISLLNVIEIFKNFKIQYEEEVERHLLRQILNYEKYISDNILNAFKNIKLDFNLDNIQDLQIEFLNNRCYGCSKIKDLMVEHYASEKHQDFMSCKFSFIDKYFSKPKKFVTKAKFIKKNYPDFFKKLPFSYRKKNGHFLTLSISKRNFNSITIENIINLNVHKSIDEKVNYPGKIYYHHINHNQVIESRKINFYSSYRSIQYDYSLIPKNIYWSRKNNFYATNEFVITFMLSLKKSKKLDIPLEILEYILNMIRVRDICKHHNYCSGEIFNFK